MTTAQPTLAVAVVTYRRPQRLERLLASLAATTSTQQWNWHRTVIVDNDPQGSAKATVDSWIERLPGLTYVGESNTGLSVARNKAVAEAHSDWVAFIDDDEEASADWLVELERTQIATDADAVMGNTTFAFESPAPRWLDGAGVYDFSPDVADQADTTYVSTNNLLLRTTLVDQLGPLFDERFNKTGGEDHHLGHRLVRGNFKLVQSTNAMTTEWVPASRMSLGVVMSRLQRDGNTLAMVDLSFAESTADRRKVQLRHLAEGIAKLPLGVARAVAYGAQDGLSGALRGLRTSVIGVGQLRAVIGQDVLGYDVAATDQG